MSSDIHLPREAVITERIQDSEDTFTMRLSIPGEERFSFLPGQFNMLYLYGVGEVPISIVPDSGNSGTVKPQPSYQNASGQYCREYQQTITVDGKTETAYGTACRQPDGSWKIVNG